MGANNSSEEGGEEQDVAGHEILNAFHQLTANGELSLSIVAERGGEREAGTGEVVASEGAESDRGREERVMEEERTEEEEEEDEDTADDEVPVWLARLFGIRLRKKQNLRVPEPIEIKYPKAEPMATSCDFYQEMVQCSPGLRGPCQSDPTKNLCDKLALRKLQFGGLTNSQRVNFIQDMMPRYSCLVDRYTARVFCGTYNRDGSMFVSAVQDNRLYLYDTERFEEYKSVIGRDIGWSILDVEFSPDQMWFAYSTWSPYVHMCNVYGEEDRHFSLDLRPDTLDHFCVFALSFSPDGGEIIASCSDGFLYVYNREVCDRTLKIDAHQDDADAVAVDSSSSHLIYSAADDGLCKVWDRRCLSESSPTPVGILAGHKDGITYIDTKGDGRYLITNSKDQSIKLWDIRRFSPTEGVSATLSEVQTQCWDYRWQDVPRRAKKDVLRKLPGDTSVMTYAGHQVKHTLLRARFSPQATTGQRYIYTACARGRVLVYDVLTGEVVQTLRNDKYRNCVRDVSWNPSKPAELISSHWDGVLQLWTHHQRPHLVSDERQYIFT